MKQISFFAGFIFSTAIAMAQAKSVQGIAEYQKSKLPAAVIELPYAPATIEAAVDEHFSKKGQKPANAKDYKVFRNVDLGGSGRYDAYLKVERKSRKEKEAAWMRSICILKRKPNIHRVGWAYMTPAVSGQLRALLLKKQKQLIQPIQTESLIILNMDIKRETLSAIL